MLPKVDFCGLQISRLIVGANPFGGYSHQSKSRDAEMIAFHTTEQIHETWHRAGEAGLNAMITNNETPRVMRAVSEYFARGGHLQWIAQVNNRTKPEMPSSVKEVVDIGCKGLYFHGGRVDRLYADRDDTTLRQWVDHAKSLGVFVGIAAHSPKAHLWVNEMDIVDFHAIPFFNCGSLHEGSGLKFKLRDMRAATECIRTIDKPCIGYKIMGAGRIDPRMAFEHALDQIKPTDVVNVGMHRGDKDDMVEENVALVEEILMRD